MLKFQEHSTNYFKMTKQNKKYKLFQNEIITYPHTPLETLASDKK